MEPSDPKQHRALEAENAKLKKFLAEQMPDGSAENRMVKERSGISRLHALCPAFVDVSC